MMIEVVRTAIDIGSREAQLEHPARAPKLAPKFGWGIATVMMRQGPN